MKYYLIIATTVVTFNLTGCSNPIDSITPPEVTTSQTAVAEVVAPATQMSYQSATPIKAEAFQTTMIKVAESIKDDTKYNKMALDTVEKKRWFKDLMYRLWDRQITRNQFITEGVSFYPTHQYEFNFVANGFQNHS